MALTEILPKGLYAVHGETLLKMAKDILSYSEHINSLPEEEADMYIEDIIISALKEQV